jgi:hypothetical protein
LPDNPHFLRLSVDEEQRKFSIRVNRLSLGLAYSNDAPATILMLSGCGTSTAVKALSATLNGRRAHYMQIGNWPGRKEGYTRTVYSDNEGYTILRHSLGLDQWHVLAITKDWRFLASAQEGRLWQLLKSDRFTTPLLRPWIGPLARRLREKNQLRDAVNYRAAGVMLLVNEKKLDEIVSDGVHEGLFKLEE